MSTRPEFRYRLEGMDLSSSFALERKRRAAAVDRDATALYDKLNPDWEHQINVSKAECIRRVEKRRKYR